MDGLSLGVSSLMLLFLMAVDSVDVGPVDSVWEEDEDVTISVGVMIFFLCSGGGGRRCRLRWWCVSLEVCRRCRPILPPP